MSGYWQHGTRFGVFRIARDRSGHWHALLEDESLGAYKTPQHAHEDLIGGYTFWPSCGVDPSKAGLPDDLTDWEFVPSR